ncbi:hypothetical protein HELRODRAFT_165061 [Helobdella robusta]|uniref:CCHC-type domain-containing protein n=1 Tax=Helobdella robusta TaxID=6412 RepID=T1EW83_HELRO|nr:hypothetical protein HELRODRAFT_165061 [Helobdella robusta]ESN92925.1 hypothetical protein HELRODRAFT_165061 [Helobdella robusta]
MDENPEEEYKFIKNQLMKDLRFDPIILRHDFYSIRQKQNERYTSGLSRLRNTLDYYFKGREVKTLADAIDLICADRLKGKTNHNIYATKYFTCEKSGHVARYCRNSKFKARQKQVKEYTVLCGEGDESSNQVDIHAPALYLADSHSLTRLTIGEESGSYEKLENIKFDWLTSLTFDPVTYSLYYSDHPMPENFIDSNSAMQRSFANGNKASYVDKFLSTNDDGIVDVIGLIHLETLTRRIFYSECNVGDFSSHSNNKLVSCDLSGKHCVNSLESSEIYKSDIGCVTKITIDDERGKLIWLESANRKIFIGDMESYDDENYEDSNSDYSEDREAANSRKKKFWTGKVKVVNVIRHAHHPIDLAYFRNQLIWINANFEYASVVDMDFPNVIKSIPLEKNVTYVAIVSADREIFNQELKIRLQQHSKHCYAINNLRRKMIAKSL